MLLTLLLLFQMPYESQQHYRKLYCIEPLPVDQANPVINCPVKRLTYYKDLHLCCGPLNKPPTPEQLKEAGLDENAIRLATSLLPPAWPDYCEKPVVNINKNEELCPKDKYEYVISLNACCQAEKVKMEKGVWVIADDNFYRIKSNSVESVSKETGGVHRLHHHHLHHHLLHGHGGGNRLH